MPSAVNTAHLQQQLAMGVLARDDNQLREQHDPSCLQANDTQRRVNQDCRLPNRLRGSTQASQGSCLHWVDTNGMEHHQH